MRQRESYVVSVGELLPLLHRKKAAAEGAAVWCAKQFVVARAVRTTFGVEVQRLCDQLNPLEEKRPTFINAAGQQAVDGCFATLVTKVGTHYSNRRASHRAAESGDRERRKCRAPLLPHL